MRSLKKSLVLLVWNEVEGCRADVPRIPREGFAEIFAIDGGSTDGTAEYLTSQGIAVFRQEKPSINAAYADAVRRARGDAVVVFFPKGTVNPAVVAKFGPLLDAGYDYVVASRNLPGARNEEDGSLLKPRKWGVAALSWFASLCWRREGWRVRDILHGVKGFTVEAYRRMQVSEAGVTVDLEMAVRAYRLRIPRTEFAVTEPGRPHGHTHFKIWPTGRRLARFLAREFFVRL